MSEKNEQLNHKDTDFPWIKPQPENKALDPLASDPVYNALARHLRKKKRKSFVRDIGLDEPVENF